VKLVKAGVFLGSIALLPATQLRQAVAEIEEMGFGTIWIGEHLGREPFAACAIVLAATQRIQVATGIANIWARDATAMANSARTLAEAWPDRFILGIGVSHASLVNSRGHQYEKPLTAMREYLDAMENVTYRAPQPPRPAPIVLAALGPKMLELARERTLGAHPYFVPVEHTRQARAILGADRVLAPEHAVVFARNRAEARKTGDTYTGTYLGLPNYHQNLERLGWPEADLQGTGSDRLFDAVVAWGDDETIARKVLEHRTAGADQVVVNVITPTPSVAPTDDLRRLAPLLLAS